MDLVEEFVETPSEGLLERCTRDQLVKIAEHFDLEVGDKRLKDNIKNIIKANLFVQGVLQQPRSVASAGAVAAGPVDPGIGGLTFEQRERLLLLEIKRLELEEHRSRMDRDSAPQRLPGGGLGFDVRSNLRLVPQFCERDPDTFFSLFERVAVTRGWSDQERTLLLQCVLTGKAQEAYSALTVDDSKVYATVKKAVLDAYELVPEAYRQRFRSWGKLAGQTYMEFGRDLSTHFHRWCASLGVADFKSLCDLIILEQFKNSLPTRISLFIVEHKVKSVTDAAALADEYVLTHRDFAVRGDAGYQGGSGKWRPGERQELVGTHYPRSDGPARTPYDPSKVCNYCRGRGHWKAECPVKAGARSGSTGPVMPIALAASVKAHKSVMSPCRGFQSSMVTPSPASCISPLAGGSVPSAFSSFISVGHVSLVESVIRVPVRILRDTGAAQSFIVDTVLPFSDTSHTGNCILMRDMGLNMLPVPVHKLRLVCGLVQGDVEMGVRPALPIPGVDIILGNILAGDRVWADPQTPVVTLPPSVSVLPGEREQRGPEVFAASAVTRAMHRTDTEHQVQRVVDEEVSDCVSPPDSLLSLTRSEWAAEQRADVSLSDLFGKVLSADDERSAASGYILQDQVLVRKWWCHGAHVIGKPVFQVVVPVKFREEVLRSSHDQSGHMGVRKTYKYILKYFFWPRLRRDVVRYVRTCHTCQLTGKPNQSIAPAPLFPIPAIAHPFEHLVIDCVGPLPRSKSGSVYLLTIMCRSTRYPAAYPLRTITTKSVVKVLSQFISIFGIPKTIQSDQGSNFSSRMFAQVLGQLGVKHNQSSAYHAQSQGVLERFHQTLKSLLRGYCVELGQDWEEGLPWLLLAAREVVQESTGFSPNDLVFGHTVRGPLALLHDQVAQAEPPVNILDYVNGFRHRLYVAGEKARVCLASAQGKMKELYDRRVEKRHFSPGDQVLALLPLRTSPFQAKFRGPYTVMRQVSDLNYLLETPERRRKTQLCHVNLLKPYFDRTVPFSGEGKKDVTPVLAMDAVEGQLVSTTAHADDLVSTTAHEDDGVISPDVSLLSGRLNNSAMLGRLESLLSHLSMERGQELAALIRDYKCLFNDVPTRTHLIEHDIDVGDAQPVRQRFYRVSDVKRKVMEKEINYMLDNKIAEPSSSSWASPCLLVDKADKSPRFCTDYRKVNAVTKPDAYPLPRMEDCVDQVGSARFVSKFDLLKGYWQVPLSPRAREISSFITPFGLFSYSVMSFGLRNAPATFQRLMNIVVSGLSGCAVYLDDVVVFSDTWEEHVLRIRQLFDRLRDAHLTVNLAKCEFARATVTYLGKVVGQGQVRPVQAKVSAIAQYPLPTTKKALMRFLGLVGYYRGFCRNFSSVVAPLTDLLKARAKYVWSPSCQQAFDDVKAMLCSPPVLAAPSMDRPFQLQVDASDVGAGAVLFQVDGDGVERPVSFFSRKFNSFQLNYSVIEKETLALVWALQHFEVYVDSSAPVVVYTDHNPLLFLQTLPCPNRRLMRWFLFLQAYCLEVRHIRGRDNRVADALSRAM